MTRHDPYDFYDFMCNKANQVRSTYSAAPTEAVASGVLIAIALLGVALQTFVLRRSFDLFELALGSFYGALPTTAMLAIKLERYVFFSHAVGLCFYGCLVLFTKSKRVACIFVVAYLVAWLAATAAAIAAWNSAAFLFGRGT
jgi:hypothetical protein